MYAMYSKEKEKEEDEKVEKKKKHELNIYTCICMGKRFFDCSSKKRLTIHVYSLANFVAFTFSRTKIEIIDGSVVIVNA